MTENWEIWKKGSWHLKRGFKVPGKAGPQRATVKEALLCLVKDHSGSPWLTPGSGEGGEGMQGERSWWLTVAHARIR